MQIRQGAVPVDGRRAVRAAIGVIRIVDLAVRLTDGWRRGCSRNRPGPHPDRMTAILF